MTLYDSETVTLLRDILEDAWEGLRFEQPTQTPKSEIALRILRLAQRGERDLYKIDATSGDAGRIMWAMDPKQETLGINRGAALWGNLVIATVRLASLPSIRTAVSWCGRPT